MPNQFSISHTRETTHHRLSKLPHFDCFLPLDTVLWFCLLSPKTLLELVFPTIFCSPSLLSKIQFTFIFTWSLWCMLQFFLHFLPFLCLSLMLSQSEQLRRQRRARTKKRNNFLRKFSHSFFISLQWAYRKKSSFYKFKDCREISWSVLKFNSTIMDWVFTMFKAFH